MMVEAEKSAEDYLREGTKFVVAVAESEGDLRFTAELMYQRVLLGLAFRIP